MGNNKKDQPRLIMSQVPASAWERLGAAALAAVRRQMAAEADKEKTV